MIYQMSCSSLLIAIVFLMCVSWALTDVSLSVHGGLSESTDIVGKVLPKYQPEGSRQGTRKDLSREDIQESYTCPNEPMCGCNNRSLKAYCKNLAYVPRLPSYVTSVALYNGNLGHINASTLRNLSGLTVEALKLHDCRISGYHGNVFGKLTNLTTLDLTGNLHGHTGQLRAALTYLNHSVLQSLILDNCGIHELSVTDSMFNALSGCNITTLSLRTNQLTQFTCNYTKMLTQLQTLKLDDNYITVFDMSGCGSLVELGLTSNKLTKLPAFSADNRTFMPNLRILNLSQNRLNSITKEHFMGLDNLTELRLNNNNLKTIVEFFMLYLPKLEILEIASCRIRKVYPRTFHSSTLRWLNFQSNHLRVRYAAHKYLFRDLPNLERLTATANNLDTLYGEKFDTFFGGHNKLKMLQVSSCLLRTLTANFTRLMPALQVVEAGANKIENWDPDTFAFAPNLTRLYLNANLVRLINKTSFPEKLLDNLKELDLSANPFDCICDLMWFRNFLRTTTIKIINMHTHRIQYRCNSPTAWKDKPLLSYNPTVKSCTIYKLNLALVLGTTLGCFTFLILILSTAIYRKRWYLKYWWHVATAKMSKYELIDGGVFQYDAFVSYNSADRLWVLRTLVPTIESKGYKLCLMDRDFIPGQYVIDNIVEGIESSRRVILVLSDNFTQSEWCKWEVTMAQHKNLRDGNRGLVLLKYKDLTSDYVSRTLAALIRERTYIEWSEDEMCERLFWEQLEATLTVPSADQSV